MDVENSKWRVHSQPYSSSVRNILSDTNKQVQMHFQRFSLVKFPALLGMNIHKMKGGDNKVSLIKESVTLVHALKDLKCPKI